MRCGLCSHVWNMIWWRMSFEGGRVLQLWQPSASQPHCLFLPPPLYRCISPLSFTRSLTPFSSLAHSQPPSGSLYWAALKPDVPVLRERAGGAAKGRGQPNDLQLQSSSFPTQQTFSPTSLYLTLFFGFIFPLLSQDLAHVPHPKHPPPPYTNKLPLLPLCLSCNASDLVLS